MRMIDEYIEYLEYQKRYSIQTVISYSTILEDFYNYLEDRNLDMLGFSYDDVKNYLKYLDTKKLSNSSVCKYISAVKGFYKYLMRKDIIKSNAFLLVTLPKKEKKLPKFLYSNEIEEMFLIPDLKSDLGLRNRLVLELLYATGIRVSELVNIEVSNIDFKERTIKVLGKGNKERIVYFGDYAKEFLDAYLAQVYPKFNKGGNKYLLLSKNGKRLSIRMIEKIINNLIIQTSIKTKATPHTIRHSFATHLLNEGCDLLTVKELLGHQSLKATQIYTHLTNDHLKDVYFHSHPRSKK